MTNKQALDALKPYRSQLPTQALTYIRNNWDKAEPVLLAELDLRLADPLSEERSALFLYALYLCAEMRCAAAFERYIAICRLPDLLRESLIGDVLTEHLPEMLARTWTGQFEVLKALVEDESVYEFVRSAGLDALHNLVIIDALPQDELSCYCIDLLTHKLTKRPSYIWDAAITLAEKLRLLEALPLIETAYTCGWANPGMQSLESVEDGIVQPSTVVELNGWREKVENFKTEHEMDFFVRNWSEEDSDSREFSAQLLQDAKATRQKKLRPAAAKIGRNTPCPCGSGKKYKKCCIFKKITHAEPETLSVDPVNKADEWIAAGYYHRNQSADYKALCCWFHGWQAIETLLPETVRDPGSSECNRLCPSSDFFSNWLQDYLTLLEDNLQRDLLTVKNGLIFCQRVSARFTDMRCLLMNNFTETTAYLLVALGKSTQAFSLLEKMITEQPGNAQGYVVLAALLSIDAPRFQLLSDHVRARQLLRQAQEYADDCDAWDVDLRLQDL
ncbi:MAG: DUF1186 domain-containing protein [Geopsychrobacter sp.]|nr:DUF1186 domain-containing protein [Geopsychrobacter sp.]